MSHPGVDTPDRYVEKAREEIRALYKYFARQMRWYRSARTVVIVAAASVPVLAAVALVPRWMLGILGAVAATAGAIEELFQFHKSALHAMKTANALERVLNKYMASVPPI